MGTVKTAISVREALFKEADALARRMRMPRSRLFVLALEEFLEHQRNKQLLEQINKAYAHGPDRAERKLMAKMRSHYRDLLKGEW